MTAIPVTDEKLLDLALRVICSDDGEECGFAYEICEAYILANHPEYNDDEITECVNEMIIQFTLQQMVNKNIVNIEFDTNGEIRYSLNEEQDNPNW